MACFLVSATEALVVSAITKSVEKHEIANKVSAVEDGRPFDIPMSRKLKWLSRMLWGGSALLAFEHVWHGEVTPWFPFLTAMGNPADAAEMLREMATVGVGMALTVTAVWGAVCATATAISHRRVDSSAKA